MLSEKQLTAIARIQRDKDAPATHLGTGFLAAANGVVLTAKHVVAGQGDKFWLVFGPRGGTQYTFAATRRQNCSGSSDWAILDCPEAGALTPLPLRELQPTGYSVSWETFGYARI